MIKIMRDDITGLRAIAVLSVLLFHIFPNIFYNGYLGVDMFFVISGFLITSILLKEINTSGSINLLVFYKKRFMRILPANILFLFIASIFALVILNYNVLKEFSNSLIWSIFGGANIFFYNLRYYYFSPDTQTRFLLHLWSLGVEWQFYLIFPLLLLVIKKQHLLSVLIVLFLLSFTTYFFVNQKFAYYMLPTRSFSLLIGSLGAYIVIYKNHCLKPLDNKTINNILSLINILFIIIVLNVFNFEIQIKALFVSIFTIFFIILGSNYKSYLHIIIQNKAFIYIGLWSFSIYLYHFLFISSYNLLNKQGISVKVGLLISLLSIICGCLSYYLIERPFLKLKYKSLVLLLILVSIIFSVFYKIGVNTYIEKIKTPMIFNKKACHQYKDYKDGIEVDKNCILNYKGKEPNILMWGDSNSAHFVSAIEEIAKKLNFSFRNISSSSCRAFTSNAYNVNESCKITSKIITERLEKYDVVILSAAWIWEYIGKGDKIAYNNYKNIVDDISKKVKIVIILANAPYLDYLDLNYIQGKRSFINFNKNELSGVLNKTVTKVNNDLKGIASEYNNVYFISFNNLLCDQKSCKYQDERGNPLYNDNTHLNSNGSKYVGEKYIEKGVEPIWYKISELQNIK